MNKKTALKKMISAVVFITILMLLIVMLGGVVLPKNRNYMMKRTFEQENKKLDILVSGSCHSYTSVNPIHLFNKFGITSYDIGQGSETIAGSYLQLVDYLEVTNPKVVLVETWGINAKDTYIDSESILGSLLASSIDNNYPSIEKASLVQDFESLGIIDDFFYLTRYKGRLIDGTITEADFTESYEHLKEINTYGNNKSEEWETETRMNNKGYKCVWGTLEEGTEIITESVEDNETLEVDAVQLKYIDKIIDLCKEKGVEVIFYRAPYQCTKSELKRFNALKQYLEDKGETFIDLEKEIDFDYRNDFSDIYHLNVEGAKKSTELLANSVKEKNNLKDHRGEAGYEEWDGLELREVKVD